MQISSRPLRRFSWAETEWIEFCARRGKSAADCASNLINRGKNTVARKAFDLGIPFRGKAGARIGHVPNKSSFDPETGRKEALKRWGKNERNN